ncbi:GNAT family N-acetyltransferase [Brevibacillus dissolubilis]|uniref:GNAT family N-acetyltransferase n=1 Tax=Brevibacillus dissolubilis TaxID=1844116 RepID=UPI001117133C|nr:GNAT family N-acetyltransferase [Brevibacillus dissolubilis]
MTIQLKPVTRDNFLACILLKSYDYKGYHLFEEHVTSNAFSLAQAYAQPEWTPRAIYDGETLVGLTMYGLEQREHFYFITRLMIDYRYQGKGYGRAAMQQVIEEIRGLGASEVYTSIVAGNEAAKGLYSSLGFEETGRFIEFGGELEPLYCLKLE